MEKPFIDPDSIPEENKTMQRAPCGISVELYSTRTLHPETKTYDTHLLRIPGDMAAQTCGYLGMKYITFSEQDGSTVMHCTQECTKPDCPSV